MGKPNNTAKGGRKAPSSHSSTLSSCVGEAEDPYDAIQDLRDEVALLEKHYPRRAPLHKHSFDLHTTMDCCWNGPYCWSAKLIPQQMKTGCIIASILK